jgi:hypothetical protein
MGHRYVEWDILVLCLFMLSLFWVRMELATSTSGLSYDSYLTVRDVEHIQQTGRPIYNDPLSVTGAKRIAAPVFDYVLAIVVLLSPLMYKLLPNLFMVLLLVPVYFLALRITQSKPMSIIAVVLAGTGPLVFSSYLVTPASAPIGLFLLLAILAMLHDPDRYLFLIITCAVLLTFISPLIFILALALLAIIVLLRLEDFGVDRRINEMFFFTLLLALWFYVIVYKQALFAEGINVLWQNLPSEFAVISFRNISFIDAINGVGIIAFLLGAIGLYNALFESRDRSSYAVIGAVFAATLALALRIIPVQLGLLLLTLLLAVMAGYGLLISLRYIELTKAPWMKYPFLAIIIAFFFFSAVLPAIVNAKANLQDTPTADDMRSFGSLRATLPADAVLLTTVKEGAAVQYYSNHTTLTDSDFLLVPNGEELVNDIDSVYTAHFSTTIVSKAAKLGFTHILFTRMAAEQYGRKGIYAEGACLQGERVGNAVLYRVTCQEAAQ